SSRMVVPPFCTRSTIAVAPAASEVADTAVTYDGRFVSTTWSPYTTFAGAATLAPSMLSVTGASPVVVTAYVSASVFTTKPLLSVVGVPVMEAREIPAGIAIDATSATTRNVRVVRVDSIDSGGGRTGRPD